MKFKELLKKKIEEADLTEVRLYMLIACLGLAVNGIILLIIIQCLKADLTEVGLCMLIAWLGLAVNGIILLIIIQCLKR